MRSASTRIALALAALVLVTFAGCKQPLPEQDSPAGQLYLQRCGEKCHGPYNPRAMTVATWEIEMSTMEEKIRQSGQPPLEPEEKRVILDYLKRNAGQQ
jgi:hypothetical protein